MISKRVLKAINDQIAKEYFSGYLYQQMAAYFEKENLKGFAQWLRVQAQEEACHGLIFYNYLCGRGGDVELGAIAAPAKGFKSPQDVFEQGLKHEFTVTASVGAIMKLAVADSDFATQSMLKWFIDEQVEEEANFDEIRSKLTRIGAKDGNGIVMLDKDLGTRVFALPPPLAASMGGAGAP